MAIGVFIVVIFDFIIKLARSYSIENSGKKIDIALGNKLFRQIMNMQLAYRHPSPATFAAHLRDFENLRNFFTATTLISLMDIPFILLFLAVIVFFGSFLTALVPIALGAIIILSAFLLEKRQALIMERSMQTGLMKNACAVEALAAMEDIKSLNAEAQWQRRWENQAVATANAGEKLRLYTTINQNISAAAIMLNMVLVVVVGVYLFSNQQITMGGIIASTMLSSRALAPLAKVSSLLMSYSQAKISLASLNQFFAIPVDRPSDRDLLARPILKGAYQLEHVSYSYPEADAATVHDINLRIEPGEKIAILGRVGAGKSTLLKMLMGFYPAGEGLITLDGTDIRQIDPNDIRREIAYAPQHPVLVHGSLKENILLGKRHVSDEAMVQAAKLAHLEPLINQSKAGFDMVIQERGDNLSAGQRQLISLARIFSGSPRTLLLDEPIGSIDMATERNIVQALKQFTQDKTLVLITHRKAMLDLADRVIVMDGGRVKADGPKEQVLAALGVQT